MIRIHPYLLALPLPLEGEPRERLRTVQALIAAGIEVRPSLLARCWAESCGGRVGDAGKYLSGARPWPTPGRKRGKLVRAVETWEAAQKPAFNHIETCEMTHDHRNPTTSRPPSRPPSHRMAQTAGSARGITVVLPTL